MSVLARLLALADELDEQLARERAETWPEHVERAHLVGRRDAYKHAVELLSTERAHDILAAAGVASSEQPPTPEERS